jgi:hypothetical protein
MSMRVKEDATLLTSLTPKERRALLKACDNGRIRSICECAYNVLRGNVPLTPKTKRQLRKHKAALRRLVKRGECWTKKRKYLVQRGGGILIPLLLNAVLPAILRAVTAD